MPSKSLIFGEKTINHWTLTTELRLSSGKGRSGAEEANQKRSKIVADGHRHLGFIEGAVDLYNKSINTSILQ